MTQYQSFPDIKGNSNSFAKLSKLRIPPLTGKSFLDIGCNAGFFCGYAKFDGATKSIGLDRSKKSITQAKQRFPDCEFLARTWDQLPEGSYDTILLASALHYAQDQEKLIHRIMERLTPDGVFILEVGAVSSNKQEWVEVKRSIDQRVFPTTAMLQAILKNYVWKRIGYSVMQDGDPIPRYVYHIRHRRPYAYLLMKPSAYGKSTISRFLFQSRAIKLISGDFTISQIKEGKIKVSRALKRMVDAEYSSQTIGVLMEKLFQSSIWKDFFEVFLDQGQLGDLAVDSYVPEKHHKEVRQFFEDAGYMPIMLNWEALGSLPMDPQKAQSRANEYQQHLQLPREAPQFSEQKVCLPFSGTKGFIDQLKLNNGVLTVKGWALNDSGNMPNFLRVDLNGKKILLDNFHRITRPDVQNHFQLNHAMCGYVFELPLTGHLPIQDLMQSLKLFGGDKKNRLDGPFPYSQGAT
ncbi:MAG: class I SAM-dependent methyltransferase [Oligoflexus sp.]